VWLALDMGVFSLCALVSCAALLIWFHTYIILESLGVCAGTMIT